MDAVATTDDRLRATLAAVAPGTSMRDGLERILRGNTGALIVLGEDKSVESLCTGGFVLDVEFSAQRLRELSKMDGAVVVTSDLSRIVRASVQLVPDPSIPTEETGTRHRTAERVAQQTGYPTMLKRNAGGGIQRYGTVGIGLVHVASLHSKCSIDPTPLRAEHTSNLSLTADTIQSQNNNT